jgi:hypothetical protein
VNADGSFSQYHYDPSGNSYTLGTVNHTIYPETINNNNVGQVISYTYTPYNGTPVTGTYSPHNAAVPSPLTIGQTWTINSTLNTTASTFTYSYSATGSFVGVESLTVPAGTFTAYKFQDVYTYLTSGGTLVTATGTMWKDATGTIPLYIKAIHTYTYSGAAPPQGSTVIDTSVLQSLE